MNSFKCIVIGAPLTGKTTLINTFMSGTFDNKKSSEVLTTYDVNFIYKTETLKNDLKQFSYDIDLSNMNTVNTFNFKIYDYEIDKSNSWQGLSDKELENIDLVILCYQKYNKSCDFLLKEASKFIKSNCPESPCVLVSCCYDIKKSGLLEDVLIEKLKAKKHFNCSSLANFNVDNMFIESFKIAIMNRLSKQESKKVEILRPKYSDEIDNDWVMCESKNKLNRELFGMNEPKLVELNQNLTVWKSASRFLISIFAFACLCMYLLTLNYCKRNKNHCDEIYELGKDVLDESISTLNDSYLSIIHQLTRFKN